MKKQKLAKAAILVNVLALSGCNEQYSQKAIQNNERETRTNSSSKALDAAIQDNEIRTNAYSYDALNRLTNVIYFNGTVETFSYDSAGNIIRHLIIAPK